MEWLAAQSPRPATGDVWVSEVPNALITPFEVGATRSVDHPRKWIRGAVHDVEGRLVRSSQRMWIRDPNAPIACDPEWVEMPEQCRELSGTWVYAGHWTRHFGHFFLESITNLWPNLAPDDIQGIVMHQSFRPDPSKRKGSTAGTYKPNVKEWQRTLLDMLGYGGKRLLVVRQRPLRVERLLVPSRPVVLKGWAHPEAVQLWRSLDASGAELRDSSRRIFLSRSRYNAALSEADRTPRSSSEWDQHLDDQFEAAGFDIVHPQEWSIDQQIALVRQAEVVAGASGSALHLSGVATRGIRVLEVGDDRSRRLSMPTQRMVDAACGHFTHFVPYLNRELLHEALRDCD